MTANGTLKTLLVKLAFIFACFTHANIGAGSVLAQFKKAQALYNQGKYQASGKILRQQIKKYPEHKPSYFILARIYYATGDLEKAAKLFLIAGKQFVTPESGLEYGVSLFAIKRYRLAVYGLKLLAKQSKDRHIADFYIGISYFNLQRWQSAESYLSRAQKLPRELRITRNRFLKEVRKRIHTERLGRFVAPRQALVPLPAPPPQWNQPTPGFPGPQTGPYPPELPPGPGRPNTKKPASKADGKTIKKLEKIVLKQGFSSSLTPRLEYSTNTTVQDMHNRGFKTNSQNDLLVALDLNARYDRSEKSLIGAIFASVDLDSLNQTFANRDTKYFATADDPDNIIVEDNSSTNASVLSTTVDTKGSIDLNFSDQLSSTLSLSWWNKLPENSTEQSYYDIKPNAEFNLDLENVSISTQAAVIIGFGTMEMAESSTTTQLGLHLSLSSGPVTLDGKMSYFSVDTPGAVFVRAPLGGFLDQITAEGTLRMNFGSINTSIYGQFLQKTKPTDVELGGVAEQLKFGASASASMGGSLSLTANTDYILINDVLFNDIPIGDDQTADFAALADQLKFQISGKFQPLEWAYLSAMVNYSIYNYDVPFSQETKALQPRFEQAVPSASQDYKLLIGASKSF